MRTDRLRRGISLCLITAFTAVSAMGCRDAVPIEDRSMAVALAVDQSGDRVTFTSMSLNSAKERSSPTVLISGTGQTAGETRFVRQRETSTRLMFGQLQVIIYGEEYARRGIGEEIDSLVRVPQVANTISVAVCQGSAAALISGKYDEQPHMGAYLRELLLKAPATIPLPRVTLHELIYDVVTTHRRALVPYLVLNEHGKPELKSVALFAGDQLRVVFDEQDAPLITLIRNQGVSGIFTFPYPTKSGTGTASFEGKSSRKVKASQGSDGEWSFQIEVTLKGQLIDKVFQDGLRRDQSAFRMMEQQLKEHLERRAAEVVKMLQEDLRIDALDLAKYAQQTERKSLAQADWDDLFTKAKIQVRIRPIITSFGEGQ